MPELPPLTLEALQSEGRLFAEIESVFPEPSLYGVTDGKAVGTYFEAKFKAYLHTKYTYTEGNAAKGIDFPALDVDMKVTSIRQPQSSCPFKSARQKIYGLGYNLLVFVYEKTDDPASRTGLLHIRHVVFVESMRTADFQTTRRFREILETDGNLDDLIGFMADIALPVDDIEARNIAEELLRSKPEQGYLTISNALQWRLQYGSVIAQAGAVDGVIRIR
jgi:hypothetical protein